jgi:hypothetical protein
MKKLFAALAAGLALLAFSGCASTGSQPQLTPAQIVAIACPPVQQAISAYIALDQSMPTNADAIKAEAILTVAQPIVTATCTAGANVSTANIEVFAQTVLPALGTIAGTLPLPPATLAGIEGGLVAAEIAVGAAGVVEANIKAAQTAASGVPAASAPVAQ